MTDEERRLMCDGAKFSIVRYRGTPPVNFAPEPGDIVSQYEILALPDGTWATVRDGEIIEVRQP